MKFNSFRLRIIITVILVVSLSSSVAFYLYSNYLSKKIYKKTHINTIKLFELINKPSKTFYLSHDSLSIEELTEYIMGEHGVSKVYYIDSAGNVRFPVNANIQKKDTLLFKKLSKLNNRVTFEYLKTGKDTLSRIFIPVPNRKECYECHSEKSRNLGYVVFDFSINQFSENLNFTRKYSILFSIFMVLVLGVFVALMHYRFVRGSLHKFQKSISIINQGNLNERVPIVDSKELGELAKCFNNMLDKFQETRRELSEYHEKELQDAQKMATIGEMSARLAHEIRNPVMGIANAIEIIVDDTKNEQNKQILQEIKRQANRVNEAVSKLLRYSRSKKLNLETQNINQLVKSVVFFLRNQSGTDKVTFVLELQSEIPDFKFDAEKIETALINLSLNAIQATGDKGNIVYRTVFNKENHTVEISVEDNGIGIPEDKINEIFKPFYTTKTEGTGLGMSIIKETVENHNGTVKVKSELGKGTIFTIILPLKV